MTDIKQGIQVCDVVQLRPVKDDKQRLFKINSFAAFVECVSLLAEMVRKRKRTYVEIVSEDRYKLAEIRAAYFCWLREKVSSAGGDGATIGELHTRYKATYLLPILCRESQLFADLVMRETNAWDGKTSPIIIKLLSVADSSVTTPKIMQEFFTACQRGDQQDGHG